MAPEIICALITVVGTVASATIAWFVSRYTANKEIERMKLSWQREDVVTSEDDFADMVAEVGECISSVHDGCILSTHKAVSKISAIRSKESGELAVSLDKLYAAMLGRVVKDMDFALTCVIEQKRKAKSHQNSAN